MNASIIRFTVKPSATKTVVPRSQPVLEMTKRGFTPMTTPSSTHDAVFNGERTPDSIQDLILSNS
jgi:hypothetical protein